MKILKYSLIFLFIIQILVQSRPSIGAETDDQIKNLKSWQESPNLALEGHEIKDSFPEKQWWLQFNDPVLTCYIERAIKENQDIKIALERINQSNALAKVLLGQEFPQLSLDDVFFRIKGSDNIIAPTLRQSPQAGSSLLTGGPSNVYALPLVAQYELDLFRKKRYQTKSAEKTAEATNFDYQTVIITITTNVASTYFNLIKTDKLLKLQTDLLQILKQTLQLNISLFEEGQSAYDNILTTEQSIAQVESNIAELQKSQGALVHQLCILMGAPPVTQSDFNRSNFDCISLNRETKSGLPSELILRRPDILSAETQLQKAGIDTSVARRNFFPTISIIGTFGYASSTLREFFDRDSITAAIGSIIQQTIFTGGSKTATLHANKAAYRSAIQNYQKTILTSFQEVEDNLNNINSDFKQYNQSELEIKSSQHLLTLTNERFQEGVSSNLDVLNSEQQLLNFEQNKIQSKGNILIDDISLYKALGGGF